MSNKSTNPEKAKPPGGADLTCIILCWLLQLTSLLSSGKFMLFSANKLIQNFFAFKNDDFFTLVKYMLVKRLDFTLDVWMSLES